ncbi:unnamed protein product [Fusarium venenatum]|uniref:Uncharacterized protein n=1 Tax=Fusarium venenatum TaxID=56646 RepID=A0A2L2T7R3_9HYPO|nr:uncharacterized protein FVRRES_02470 [Fusarium venenatum]CEI65958.1 unnamed protein product [Fusarium venenatum]
MRPSILCIRPTNSAANKDDMYDNKAGRSSDLQPIVDDDNVKMQCDDNSLISGRGGIRQTTGGCGDV